MQVEGDRTRAETWAAVHHRVLLENGSRKDDASGFRHVGRFERHRAGEEGTRSIAHRVAVV